MKLRRSMLFVPGANAAMISNTFIYKPDSIMFDLEDSVALAEKDTARMLVASWKRWCASIRWPPSLVCWI